MIRHQMTRQALYDTVWARPMTRVSADYGLTGTGLKKICDRNAVPTPDRGYWAKLAHGKAVRRHPLKTDKIAADAVVHFQGFPQATLPEPVRQATDALKTRLERPAPPVEFVEGGVAVAPEPPPLHAVAARTAKALARARPGAAGFITVQADNLPLITVGAGSIDRTVRLIDQLGRRAEALGWNLVPGPGGLRISVEGEPLSIVLGEKPAKVPHHPTAGELKEKARADARGQPAASWPETDLAPSGALTLEIRENIYGPVPRKFSDLKARPLEARLDEILTTMAAHAALNLDNRRKADEARKRHEEAEALRRREQAFDGRETRRVAMIDAIHDRLAECAKLTAVLAHLDSLDLKQRIDLIRMQAWIGYRLRQLDVLLSAQHLDISLRFAEVSFAEPPAGAPDDRYRYYARPPEPHLWSIDLAKDQATMVSGFGWALETGALGELTPRGTTAAASS